ncbi:FHA domain-containing protein [Microbacterium natoriense]
MQTIYRPGQWYLIVIPGALVALPPDVPSDIISRLWDRLPAEKTLASVVDVLTTAAGGSFVALPPFVAAVAEGADVRIALRGGVVARVSCGTDAAYELSGAEVTTWSERFVAGATRIEITVEETDAASALPVQSGIVCAAAVSAELETSDAEPIVAVLGPAPRIDEIEAGASAASLGGGPAPALALFGVPSAPHVDDVPDAPPAVDASPVVEQAEVDGAPVSDQDEEPAVVDQAEEDETPASDLEDEPPVVEQPEEDETPASDLEDEPPVAEQPEEDETPVSDQNEEPPVVERAERDETPEPVLEAITAEEAEEDPSLDDNGLDEHTWEPPEQTFAPADDSAASDIDEFEQLFGETLHSGTGQPIGQPAAAPAIPPLPGADLGDHDGATISASELAALRQQRASSDETATQVLPVLPAVPGASGRIRISTGQAVELDRTVIIGRRPRATRASGDSMPHLVAVDSPQQDISRSHLEVRPEAGSVVVIDLHTTNGSTLLRPGADPVRLHPGEQTLVLSGDVVDLGDGVTVAFEGVS